MHGWKCYLISPSDFCRRSLRRHSPERCLVHEFRYHNARVIIDSKIPAALSEMVSRCYLPEEFRGDPRWPEACVCGRPFIASDEWQVDVERLYAGFEDGRLRSLRDPDVPPGAIWDADWMPDTYRGPDGKAWCLRLPAGIDWIVHGPSADGRKWNVIGIPPAISVSPSIAANGLYHGFVQGGLVTPDCEGRKFSEPFTA